MSRWPIITHNRRVFGFATAALAIAALLAGCPQAGQTTIAGLGGNGATNPNFVFFESQIQPIFDLHCIACHSGGNGQATIDGGTTNLSLDLTRGNSYNSLIGTQSQEDSFYPLVEPGVPDTSWLYIKIAHDIPPRGLRMPPGIPLSPSEIELIRLWIEQGALPG